ncbi:N-acetylmuramoyl-L-alanine amidase, partial [Helicobacter bizzozeronii]|uniref:N-acetylmuramoyl-L-alanine amidase n=1 Tax=Helicobacter bizzozeronii TaxID=56877 RepID=UPI0025545E0C
MRTINKVIIHCSATKEEKDFCALDIDRWHKERGWKCVGYHYVIKLDGTIEKGRALADVGAHCVGQNKDSIGICYIGGLDSWNKSKDTRTPKQKEALKDLFWNLKSSFLMPNFTGIGILKRAKIARVLMLKNGSKARALMDKVCSIENSVKRLEKVERFGLFIMFVGVLQICVLGFMLVESFVLLQNANA